MLAAGQHLELRSGKAVFTDWGPRGEDNARFYIEVLDGDSTSTALEVAVFHKDREDTSGTGAISGSAVTITVNTARGYVEVTGLLELVRLRFKVTAGSWARFRVLGVCWYDTAPFTPPPPPSPPVSP